VLTPFPFKKSIIVVMILECSIINNMCSKLWYGSWLMLLNYMQMNTLGSLLKICHQLPDKNNKLSVYQANRFNFKTPLGKSVAEVGCEPILHMRHFQVSRCIALYFYPLMLNCHNFSLHCTKVLLISYFSSNTWDCCWFLFTGYLITRVPNLPYANESIKL
jgi:hypothetical protein